MRAWRCFMIASASAIFSVMLSGLVVCDGAGQTMMASMQVIQSPDTSTNTSLTPYVELVLTPGNMPPLSSYQDQAATTSTESQINVISLPPMMNPPLSYPHPSHPHFSPPYMSMMNQPPPPYPHPSLPHFSPPYMSMMNQPPPPYPPPSLPHFSPPMPMMNQPPPPYPHPSHPHFSPPMHTPWVPPYPTTSFNGGYPQYPWYPSYSSLHPPPTFLPHFQPVLAPFHVSMLNVAPSLNHLILPGAIPPALLHSGNIQHAPFNSIFNGGLMDAPNNFPSDVGIQVSKHGTGPTSDSQHHNTDSHHRSTKPNYQTGPASTSSYEGNNYPIKSSYSRGVSPKYGIDSVNGAKRSDTVLNTQSIDSFDNDKPVGSRIINPGNGRTFRNKHYSDGASSLESPQSGRRSISRTSTAGSSTRTQSHRAGAAAPRQSLLNRRNTDQLVEFDDDDVSLKSSAKLGHGRSSATHATHGTTRNRRLNLGSGVETVNRKERNYRNDNLGSGSETVNRKERNYRNDNLSSGVETVNRKERNYRNDNTTRVLVTFHS